MGSLLVCIALLAAIPHQAPRHPSERHHQPNASLAPEAIEARTPPENAWSGVSFDPSVYFDPEERRVVAERGRVNRQMSLLDLGQGLLWYVLFLIMPWAAALRDAAGRGASGLGRQWPLGAPAFAKLARVPARLFGHDWAGAWLFAWTYFGLSAAVSLPMAVASEALAQSAGLSTYTACAWVWDFVKQIAIHLLLFSCLVMGLYGLVRRFPRSWWLILGLPAALALVGYGVVEPRLARIYHQVTPLHHSPVGSHRALASRLEALARAEGVALSRIQVIRASRTTRALDAYLVGLGDSRELVIYDTLLEEASPREVAVAVAHELGHEHHRRDVFTYSGAALALIALLGILALLLRWAGSRPGMRGPGDVATLPILGFGLWLFFLALQPATSYRQRSHEREADRRALVLTADPEAFIQLQVRLARTNQAELRPPRWVQLLWGSHPTVEERISTALWYGRWLAGMGLSPGRSQGFGLPRGADVRCDLKRRADTGTLGQVSPRAWAACRPGGGADGSLQAARVRAHGRTERRARGLPTLGLGGALPAPQGSLRPLPRDH